jgi:hypothetical protein
MAYWVRKKGPDGQEEQARPADMIAPWRRTGIQALSGVEFTTFALVPGVFRGTKVFGYSATHAAYEERD